MTPEQVDLLVAVAMAEARGHVRHVPTDTCIVNGEPWPCGVKQAADAIEASP